MPARSGMLKETTEFSFLNDNYVYDLRNLGASDYQQGGTVPHLIEMCKGNATEEETAMEITKSWRIITDQYGLEEQRTFYRNVLGLPEYIGPAAIYGKNLAQLRTIIVAVTVPVAIIAIILVLVVLKQRHTIKFHTRDIINAPKAGTIAILFTDVEGSTNLWDTDKDAMQKALEVHHNVIRTCIDKYSAYEVKTVGDAFMIAIDSADKAVLLANDIQLALLNAEWPLGLLRMPTSCNAYFPKSRKERKEKAAPKLMFSGLRVRIGIHLGQKSAGDSDLKNSTSRDLNSNSEIQVMYDHVTKGFDYYGQVVNAAARIEGIGFGGQTIISDQVYSQVSEEVKRKCAFLLIGAMELRGVTDEMTVYSCLPEELRGRKFQGIYQRQTSMESTIVDQFGRIISGSRGSIPSMAPRDLDVMSLSPVELQRQLKRMIQLACNYEEQLATFKMMNGAALDEISFDGMKVETQDEYEKRTSMIHVNLEDDDLSEDDDSDGNISIGGVDEEGTANLLMVAEQKNSVVSKNQGPFL